MVWPIMNLSIELQMDYTVINVSEGNHLTPKFRKELASSLKTDISAQNFFSFWPN